MTIYTTRISTVCSSSHPPSDRYSLAISHTSNYPPFKSHRNQVFLFRTTKATLAMTRRHGNSLVSIGGPSRGKRHHSTKDVLSDGMKYGAAFGIAREGFKAWGSHNNNQQQVQMQQPAYQPVYQQPIQREYIQSLPPYQQSQQRQEYQQMRQFTDGSVLGGHRAWCNGQCSGRCGTQLSEQGEAASYYNVAAL